MHPTWCLVRLGEIVGEEEHILMDTVKLGDARGGLRVLVKYLRLVEKRQRFRRSARSTGC